MLTLGFDTSNYTTSVAAFDGVGGKNCSRLLDVKPGELGLRQSDALFAHVKRLPELVDALCTAVEIKNVTAVGVSTRPRASKAPTCRASLQAGRRQAAWHVFWTCRCMNFPTSRGILRRASGQQEDWN